MRQESETNETLQNMLENLSSIFPTMRNSSEAYLPAEFRWTATLAYSTTALVGVFGNLLVIGVVLSMKGMISPTNCYLVSLAAADCLCFLSSTPTEIVWMHVPEDVYIFGEIGCRLLTFLSYLAINASSLSIAAFTLERYIGICHPMKAQFICTVKRAKMIICFIWIFSVLYTSPWLFLTGLSPLDYEDWKDACRCTFKMNRSNYKAIFMTDMLLFYWIPFFLYIVVYGRIVFTLYGNYRDLCCKKTSTKLKRKLGSFVEIDEMTSANFCIVSTRRSVRSNRSRVQIVNMLIAIVFTFTICWLPYRGLVVYNSFASQPWIEKWYLLVAKTMIYINCALNPILYHAMSAKFRGAFRQVFRQLLHMITGK
ncbi:Thyrotropin-releasing hormone receptor [Trichinella nativa]|uniref:Thyrotropin-releasing hormone receptor n=1 Tax=Trichinella nativa TaxID=6335 RepID=A0A0V1KY20_9BILA|nr:Thyrotropin-releasing hormone receptor [Trichinella nativa]OUC48041.1 putative 7 transmembrane receptor [Trichinella nativa]